MAAKWEVSDTTATYTNDAGKVVATLKGLKSGLKVSNGSIAGITVTEGTDGGTGSIKLDANVLTTTNVSLSLSNGGKYELGLNGSYPKVESTDMAPTVSSGTLTFKGNLTAGYKVKDAKNITYSVAKKNQTLATVKGLNAALVVVDGKIGINQTDENTGETTGETTFVEAVTFEDDVVTLTADALAGKNVTLSMGKNLNTSYTLAFDGSVNAPELVGEWDYSTKGKAIYKGTVSGAGGYRISLDGKTVAFTAPSEKSANLITISGVTSPGEADGLDEIEHSLTSTNQVTITLPASVLNKGKVTVNGTGYVLALDEDVNLSTVAETNIWVPSNATYNYKHIKPEYYTYDESNNSVTYTKQADLKTLATVSNLVKGLTVGTDTYDESENLNGTGNSALYANDGADLAVSVNSSSGVITMYDGALDKKNVTFKNGKDENYSIALSSVDPPQADSEEWSVSGTTATLKGKVTTEGYAKTSDTTITYVKAADKLVTLATVKGLAKGVALESKTATGAVGMNTKDSEGNTVFTAGLTLEAEGSDTINISANVLGTTDATITPTAGFTYKFALDEGSGTGGAVPTTPIGRTFWYITGSNLQLKDGYANYYTKTSDTLITQTDEVVNSEVATVSGLKSSGLKVVDGDIDGITVSGKKITLSKDVLDKADVKFVSNTGGYKFALASKDLEQHEGTTWEVNGTTAVLEACMTDGYKLDTDGKTLTYKSLNPGVTLATLTGLKSGLKVVDNEIDGITVGEIEDSGEAEADVEVTPIYLSSKVLNNADVTLDEDGLKNGYSLFRGDGVSAGSVEGEWSSSKAGTAVYTETMTKGYEEVEYEPTDATISEGLNYKLTYRNGKVKTTISGLNSELSASDLQSAMSDYAPDSDGVIKLGTDVLANTTTVKISGSKYTLGLAEGVDAPVAGEDLNWQPDSKTKTKATLNGSVTEGWEVSSDALSIVHTPASEEGETSVLATVTGLKSGLTADELNDGITVSGSEIILGKDVLGGTKLAVTGGSYTLALGEGVHTSAEDVTGWVTSGTTATYKSYKSEYYTPDAKGTTVKFTKATAGTTYATVKGVAKDADLSSIGTSKTITLTNDMLGASNVTLTGSGYTLKLASSVPTKAVNAEEWVTNGTTATFKNYDRAYYTGSGNTITYHKPTAGTTYATVKGIKSGATITDNNKVITLSADQLDGRKVTLTGSGYSLTLDDDVDVAEAGSTWWEQSKGTGKYNQIFSAGYTLANANTVNYSSKETTTILATVSGLDSTVTYDSREADEVDSKGKPVSYIYNDIEVEGITIDDEANTITLTDVSVFGSEPKDKAKITLKSDTYQLVSGIEEGDSEDPVWTLDKNKKTATYTQDKAASVTVTDNKTATYYKPGTTTLATISGLDKNKLNDLDITWESNKAVVDIENYGISVDGKKIKLLDNTLLGSSKITLGKNDQFEFDVSAVAPQAGTNKWALSGTTATYNETTTEGYNATDTKNVAYVKEAIGDTIFTITGLKKGLKTDGTNVGVETKEKVTDENTGRTTTVTSISNGIEIRDKVNYIGLNSEVLGTTNIALTNDANEGYQITQVGGNEPGSPDLNWTYSGGTATYKKIQNSGYTLEDDYLNVTYTAAKTETLATVKGLNKTFTGNLDSAISVSGEVITLQSGLLGASNVTLTLPKNGTKYSLALGSGVAQKANEATEWVTSGTSATYKTYNQAYYVINPNTGAIAYNKPKDIQTYATIKGIRSGVDINDASTVGDGTIGGTVTLAKKHLGTSGVTVSVTKGNSATFTLALAKDVPSSPAQTTEWVTSGSTASYKLYDKGGYTLNENGAIVYAKGSNTKGTEYASIKGAASDVTATLASDGKTFTIMGTELTNKVNIGSVIENEAPKYNFSFNNDYNNSAITGSANADVITVAGDRLTITGGKGDDTITLGTGDRVGNVIVYSKGDGNDVIANFQAGDALQIKSGFNGYEGGETITVGTGTSEGTITLGFIDGEEPEYITINGTQYETGYSSDNLLADDNYSTNAAQLSEIVKPTEMKLTSYDFDSGLGLTKEDKFTAAITYAKDK